jgi:hypothetical protein
MTKCFPARQTTEDTKSTETAAKSRSSRERVTVQDMILDYRMPAR